MVKIINVDIKNKDKSYPICIGEGISGILFNYLQENHADKKVVLITDKEVRRLYSSFIDKFPCNLVLVIPKGEKSKSRKIKAGVEDVLLKKKYGRDTLLVAFGGGVVGDLTGFVASTYNRGIPFIQIPTTLLSMVDASIGGKTGINTKHGKNLIGSFHQPEMVLVDTYFLETLNDEEYLNGLAEIIKTASILDRKLFDVLEKDREKILEKEDLLPIIKKSIELKKKVVVVDAKERGLRQILNFGHTLGHGIEAAAEGKLKHGFAVSIGMVAENEISSELGILSYVDKERIKKLLENYQLPVRIPEKLETEKILESIRNDKKNSSGKIMSALLKKIGEVKSNNNQYSFSVREELIREIIDRHKQ